MNIFAVVFAVCELSCNAEHNIQHNIESLQYYAFRTKHSIAKPYNNLLKTWNNKII